MSLFSRPTSKTDARDSEIERLRDDNARLRRRLRLVAGNADGAALNSLAGANSLSGVPSESFSLAIKEFGSVSVDRGYKILQLNTFTANLFGASRESCAGQPLSQLDRSTIAPEVLSTLLIEASSLPPGTAVEHEVAWTSAIADGPPRWMHFKAVWQGDVGTVMIQDVTVLRQTRTFFERLVSPHIVAQLLSSPDNPAAPQHRTISLLFGDLRSFTTYCDAAPSLDAVSRVCNDFFDACANCLKESGGTLDKFVGDEVMALFGAPLDQADHAARAIHFAVLLQSALASIRNRWIAEEVIPATLLAEKPDVLKLGIGINTATMIVGLFGNATTGQYTALGPGVNLCARLCGAAAGGQILATRETMASIQELGGMGYQFKFQAKFRAAAPISVKGLSTPVEPIAVEWS